MTGTDPYGEARAARFLARRGWRILARNWRGGGGELDIVALRAGMVAFVEVKSRVDPGALHDPVTPGQRRRWMAAGHAFLARRPDLARASARFDLITIDTSRRRRRVRHLPDVLEIPPRFGNPDAGAPSAAGRGP